MNQCKNIDKKRLPTRHAIRQLPLKQVIRPKTKGIVDCARWRSVLQLSSAHQARMRKQKRERRLVETLSQTLEYIRQEAEHRERRDFVQELKDNLHLQGLKNHSVPKTNLSACINMECVISERSRAEMFSLQEYKPRLSTSQAKLPHNLHKNRSQDLLPVNRYRYKLKPLSLRLRSCEAYDAEQQLRQDYINATVVNNGYQEMLVTPHPLSHTIGDFWRMVKDSGASIIIMLIHNDANLEQFPRYWPLPGEVLYHFVNTKTCICLKNRSSHTYQDYLSEQKAMEEVENRKLDKRHLQRELEMERKIQQASQILLHTSPPPQQQQQQQDQEEEDDDDNDDDQEVQPWRRLYDEKQQLNHSLERDGHRCQALKQKWHHRKKNIDWHLKLNSLHLDCHKDDQLSQSSDISKEDYFSQYSLQQEKQKHHDDDYQSHHQQYAQHHNMNELLLHHQKLLGQGKTYQWENSYQRQFAQQRQKNPYFYVSDIVMQVGGRGGGVVRHYHYQWDQVAGMHHMGMIELVHAVMHRHHTVGGPIIIHCQNGYEASGAVVVMSSLIQKESNHSSDNTNDSTNDSTSNSTNDSINVYECVANLKRFIPQALSSVELYRQLYECHHTYLTNKKKWRPLPVKTLLPDYKMKLLKKVNLKKLLKETSRIFPDIFNRVMVNVRKSEGGGKEPKVNKPEVEEEPEVKDLGGEERETVIKLFQAVTEEYERDKTGKLKEKCGISSASTEPPSSSSHEDQILAPEVWESRREVHDDGSRLPDAYTHFAIQDFCKHLFTQDSYTRHTPQDSSTRLTPKDSYTYHTPQNSCTHLTPRDEANTHTTSMDNQNDPTTMLSDNEKTVSLQDQISEKSKFEHTDKDVNARDQPRENNGLEDSHKPASPEDENNDTTEPVNLVQVLFPEKRKLLRVITNHRFRRRVVFRRKKRDRPHRRYY